MCAAWSPFTKSNSTSEAMGATSRPDSAMEFGMLATGVVFAVGLTAGAQPYASAPASQAVAEEDPFGGFDGCFVMLDVRRGKFTRIRPERCAERLSPCSTFKIPNALVGLETGVLSGAEHEFNWDGVRRERAELNHDHTLRTAIRDSVVWYFQRVAAGVGDQRMRRW